MPAEIIIGAPGSGKTEDIYKDLINSALQFPNKKHIVITPEQNTLLTEKRLLAMNPKHILFNIDVLSFNRAAHLVFEKAGIGNPEIIDETGKSMLLRRIIGKNSDAIRYYSSNIHMAGFINKLKVMISELLMYGITPDDISSYIDNDEIKANDTLKAKLTDLKNILDLFTKAKDEHHLTTEELIPKSLTYIDDSKLFDNSYVVFDGYVGFTPIQYEFIKSIESKCDKVVFSFDISSNENVLGEYENHELFYPVKDTIRKLQDSFSEIGKKIYINKHEDKSRVPRDIYLTHLSNNYLRNDAKKLEIKFSEEAVRPSISIWSCLNPVKEAEFIAHEILRCVKEDGLKYRDIAVVTGNLDNNNSVFKEIFAKEGIPAYIDKKDSITSNPLCIFLLSLIETVEKSFKGECVLRHAKSSLANISFEELDILENYVIAHGVNGINKWSNDFTKNYYRYHENLDLEYINRCRKNLINPIIKFKEEFIASKTISSAIDAIYNVFNECKIKEKIEKMASDAYDNGDIILGGTFDQIYDVILGILDQLKLLIGDEKRPPAKEFREIIKSGIEDCAIGSLPPSIDEVHVGDIRRSRMGYVKVLFFASFNEGVVPSPLAGGGILNDLDRHELEAIGVNLAPSSKQTSFDEQYTLYQIISTPTKRLYFTYSRLSLANENLNPSSYLGHIKDVFVELKENNYISYDFNDISNSYEAISYLAKNLNKNKLENMDEKLAMLCSSISNEADLRKVRLILEASFFNYQGEYLNEKSINTLFSNDIYGSVSMLETHASCAFKYFLRYILQLKERVELDFSPFDRGNFYHSVLEKTFNNIIKLDKPYEDISEDNLDEIIFDAIVSSKDVIKSFDIFETGKGEYFLEKWKKIIKTTTKCMVNNLIDAPFKPAYIEKEFNDISAPSLNIALKNNSMKMKGKIDRVDVCKEVDKINFKIVDYKSYETKLDKNLVDGGIQLQLLTYLNAMEDVLKSDNPNNEIVKSGVSYFGISQKYINANSLDDDVSEKIYSAYKYTSKEDELDELTELVRQRNKEIAENIVSGEISKNPYVHNKTTPCDGCEYKDMCNFDIKLNGYTRRNIAYKDLENVGGSKDGV